MVLRKINAILILSKVKITGMVAFTTLAGYMLAGGNLNWHLIPLLVGIFLLACGSSVINQMQEVSYDALMQRTRQRPLPVQEVGFFFAGILAMLLSLSGFLFLYFYSGVIPALVALSALICYNLIYTPLKKITAHAVIPGSLVGAIPPLAGWITGGASLTDSRAWILASFYFVWQIPHFYLLSLRYARDYEAAGFPTLLSHYTERTARRIIYFWLLITTLTVFFIQGSGLIQSTWAISFTGIAVIWINYVFFPIIRLQEKAFHPSYYFYRINLFVLFITFILILESSL